MNKASSRSAEFRDAAATCRSMPSELLPEIYDTLRRMARRQLRGERVDHTLNSTALVHEVWMRLVASYPQLSSDDRDDYLALSGHLMRRVLVDHARHRGRQRRSGGLQRMTWTEGLQASPDLVDTDDLLALDRALVELEQLDERQVRVVELRYFSGFTVEDTARVLDLSPATVKREWSMARAWLFDALREGE